MPVSRELVTLAGLAAVTLALVMAAPGTPRVTWRCGLSMFLARAHEFDVADGSVFRLGWRSGCFAVSAFRAGGACSPAWRLSLVQTRFLLNPQALRLDFARISPRAGLKRLFGADSLVEAVKSVAKVTVLAVRRVACAAGRPAESASGAVRRAQGNF